MKMRMFLAALMLTACALQVGAQSELLEKVNAIKVDQRYVYGEAMHENEDTAFLSALDVMKMKLENRLNTKVDDKEVKSKVKHISRPMEGLVRVMAYIEVEEVTPSTPVVVETSSKPQVSVHVPSATQATTNKPNVETRPTQNQSDAAAQKKEERTAAPATLDAKVNAIVTDLMATEHLQGAVTVLDRRKKAGIIHEYAPYSKVTNPGSMYILIFDSVYNIPIAVLSPENSNGKRVNLVTNNEETLADYKDNLAVCFSMR